MNLSHEWPAATAEGRERIETALRADCWCEGRTCSVVKRRVGAAWTVYLQCDRCGGSLSSGAMKRSDFPKWEALTEWDAHRNARFMESYREQSISALADRRAVVERQMAERRREYAAWCKTSSDWATTRAAVLRRANYICEACLNAPAVTAHHLTYDLGKLPPAWELRAVCKTCHERLHADVLGAADEWCPRSIPPKAAE